MGVEFNGKITMHYSRGVRGDSSVSLQGLDFRHPMVLGLIAMNMYLVVQGVASHSSISTVWDRFPEGDNIYKHAFISGYTKTYC